MEGVSENISVTSIVGRFLEHSRIYYFLNGDNEEIYIGSADLMPRNLDRRVETLFPIDDEKLRARVKQEILDCYLVDTVKARGMQSDGTYVRVPRTKDTAGVDAQVALISEQPRTSRVR
jgi:polyphosphate kinase